MPRIDTFDKLFEEQENLRETLVAKYKALSYKFRYKMELYTYFSSALIDIIQPISEKINLNKEGFLTLNVESLNVEEKEWIEKNEPDSLGHWKSGRAYRPYASGGFSIWSYIPLRPSQEREEIILKKMLPSEIKIYHQSFIPIAEQIEKMDKELDDLENRLWYSGYYADNAFNDLIREFGEDILPDR